MLIKSLELHNIKSYGEDAIPIRFKPGVNLICGRNGGGKSTILESIGFALFGALDYKQAQLRREGEEQGEIRLTFESPIDERPYQIVRGVGRSRLRIYDVTTKTWLTRSKRDSEDWLREQLNIDLAYAKELFSNVIGVSQGKMTGSFLESARSRKPIFSPLLRVEEYETAWKKLRETTGYLNEKLQEANKIVARLEGRLERLPQVEKQAERLTRQLASDQTELKEAGERLDSLEMQLMAFSQAQKKVETVAKQLDKASRQLERLTDKIKSAEEALRAAQEAAARVAENEAGYVAYQEATRQRTKLDAARKRRDKALKAIQSTEKKLTKANTTLKHLAQRLIAVATAEKRVIELLPLVEEQQKLEVAVRDAEKQVTERRRLRKRVAEQVTHINDLKLSLQKIRKELAKRAKIEEQLAPIRGQQAALSKTVEELTSKNDPVQAQRKPLEKHLRQAERDKRDFKNAKKRLADEQRGLQQQQQMLKQIDVQLKERLQLEKELDALVQAILHQQSELSTAEAEEAQSKESAKTLKQRLSVLQNSEMADCPVCQRPLGEHLAQEVEAEFKREQKSLKARQSKAKKRKQVSSKEIKRLQSQQRSKQLMLNKLPAASRADELKHSIARQEVQITTWQAQSNELAGADEAVNTHQQALDALDETLVTLIKQRNDAQQAYERLNKQHNKLNRQLTRLPQPSRADELATEVGEADAQRTSFEQQVAALADAPAELARLQAALAKLNNPRTKQAAQQAIADERGKLEKEQRAEKARQTKLLSEQAKQQGGLEQFATLDDELDETKKALKTNKKAYQQYIAYEKVGGTRTGHEKTVLDLNEARSKQEESVEEIESAHALAATEYDGDAHDEAKEEAQETNERTVELRTQIESNNRQLKQAKKELTNLKAQQKALNKANIDVARYERLSETFRFVRDGIREAGPAVVKRRVRLISHQADHIFQDILEDPAFSLSWDETYAISIHHRGETRDFAQLSGGEQMAAAIAVRLALLMQMSQIRLLFLDEPTTNLDDHRRDRLADRITQLDGLRQIFVITHDDAFERDTHHVLRVHKEDGTSFVQMG